tara:strand:- start:22 stop:135 length:114 start_codon:yes stop_codon:yes gene_type:complete
MNEKKRDTKGALKRVARIAMEQKGHDGPDGDLTERRI